MHNIYTQQALQSKSISRDFRKFISRLSKSLTVQRQTSNLHVNLGMFQAVIPGELQGEQVSKIGSYYRSCWYYRLRRCNGIYITVPVNVSPLASISCRASLKHSVKSCLSCWSCSIAVAISCACISNIS